MATVLEQDVRTQLHYIFPGPLIGNANLIPSDLFFCLTLSLFCIERGRVVPGRGKEEEEEDENKTLYPIRPLQACLITVPQEDSRGD